MDELLAPVEPWEMSGTGLVSLSGIVTTVSVFVAPENFSDYLQPPRNYEILALNNSVVSVLALP